VGVRRSRAPRDILGDQGVAVIANHRSRSIDLAGADTDAASSSVTPASDDETKQWNNKSTEVLDISMETPVPPFPLPEPEPRIHTDVRAELSPSSSHSTPVGPSRSSIRRLPTPPTRAQVRRHRSAKAEEAYRPLAHRRTSADDVRWSTVHSENSKSPWTDFPPPYSETCESV